MPGRKGKKRIRKALVVLLKWVAALVPVCGFIYILYYYKQFDFLKEKPVVRSKTEIVGEVDTTASATSAVRDEALLKKVKILENEWHSVGGIAIHNITVENGTAQTISSVEIEFKYLSDTQSVLTSKIITVKAKIAPGKSTKVSGVSVGYVNNSVVGCDTKVVNIK